MTTGTSERKPTVNRGDLVRQIAEDTGIPQTTVNLVLSSMTDMITVALRSEKDVVIRHFGRWTTRVRPAVVRPNPKTLEPMEIPARVTTSFLPAPALKELLNKRRRRRKET